MTSVVTFILFSFVLVQSVGAETCREKFVELVKISKEIKPSKNQITVNFGDGRITNNEFWSISADHYMTIVPGAQEQWVLGYSNTLFFSLDKGKNWKVLRKMDSQENLANTERDQIDNAKTVKNAICGEEEFEGVIYDTTEADITILQNINAEYRYKYWVDKKSKLIIKATYEAKKSGQLTTQVIKYTPGLTLPMPE